MRQTLMDGAAALAHPLSDTQLDLCCTFAERMLAQNTVMNLTAITDPQEVARLHFLDSIALLSFVPFSGCSVVDVGCGAGFPGVPLCIAEPGINLTLLDSQRKRMDWLGSVLSDLNLPADLACARAEDYAADHREQYDIAVSRAVARLNVLLELALPLVRTGGCFLAMKGIDSDEELSQAAHSLGVLGGKVEAIHDYTIPGTGVTHRCIVLRKIRSTPRGYPRRFAKIKQHPL